MKIIPPDIKGGKSEIVKHKKFILPITPKRDRLMLRLGVSYRFKKLFIRQAVGYRNGKQVPLEFILPTNFNEVPFLGTFGTKEA